MSNQDIRTGFSSSVSQFNGFCIIYFGADWGENGFLRIGYGQCEIDLAFMFAKWDEAPFLRYNRQKHMYRKIKCRGRNASFPAPPAQIHT
jgi:hypothetical protein